MNYKEYLASEPIVIVEDSSDLVATLKELLADFEVPIRTFTSPKEALSELRLFTPSLIFSDFNMEGMNGVELSREIRKILPTAPIVLLTGFGTKEVAVQALGAGVNDLIDKPIEAEKLLSVTETWLRTRCEFHKREREELEAILDSFVEEGLDLMRGIDELLLRLTEPDLDSLVVDNLFRKIHSIKGSAGAVPFTALLGKLSHAFESALDLVRKGQLNPEESHVDLFLVCADMVNKLLRLVGERQEPAAELGPVVEDMINQLKAIKPGAVVKEMGAGSAQQGETKAQAANRIAEAPETEDAGLLVSHQKLDNFLKLSGEMTMVRNYFQLLTRDSKAQNKPEILFKKAEEMLRGFNNITESLQKNIMEIRQVQFQEVFSKLPRLARTSAQQTGKKIRLQLIGGSLSVDKSIAKDLAVVLSHMVRNSVDHGIEMPQERAALKKAEEGTLTIESSISNGMISVEIKDDGGGINPDKIFARAVERGLIEENSRSSLKEQDILQIIFLPGFSTAAKVTSISGRGVGMDVVKNLVSSHHGRIEIESKVGQGSTFRLLIPVPKSVMVENTILVKYEDLFFVIPQSEILTISQAAKFETQKVSGMRFFQFKGKTVPLVTYDELMEGRAKLPSDQVAQMSVVVLQHSDMTVGLLVHGTEGQLDAVILPFDGMVKKIHGFKGTTLLGSEGLAYVVSSQQLVHLMRGVDQNNVAVA